MQGKVRTWLLRTALGVFGFLAMVSPVEGQGFCWRGQPSPACSGFLLFDVHGHRTVVENGRETTGHYVVYGPNREPMPATNSRQVESFTWAGGVDVGYAWNVSSEWALGGTAGFEFFEGGTRKVFKARARRWLGHGLALDLEPGVFSFADSRWDSGRTVRGGLMDVRFDLGGLGFLGVRWEAMKLDPEVWGTDEVGGRDPGGFQQGLAVGAGFGSQAGIFSFSLTGLLLIGLTLLIGAAA